MCGPSAEVVGICVCRCCDVGVNSGAIVGLLGTYFSSRVVVDGGPAALRRVYCSRQLSCSSTHRYNWTFLSVCFSIIVCLQLLCLSHNRPLLLTFGWKDQYYRQCFRLFQIVKSAKKINQPISEKVILYLQGSDTSCSFQILLVMTMTTFRIWTIIERVCAYCATIQWNCEMWT